MPRQLLIASAFAVASLAASGVAAAQSTIHTSLGAFTAATQGPLYTEQFPWLPSSNYGASLSYSGSGFAYTVTAPSAVYLGASLGTFIGNAEASEALTFTFTSGNVTAIGGNFFLTNLADEQSNGTISFLLSDGTSTSFVGSSITDFRGFTTTGAVITSLTLLAPGSLYNSVDNFVVGTAATVVPEPSTYVLVAVGLLSTLGVARRRNRAR